MVVGRAMCGQFVNNKVYQGFMEYTNHFPIDEGHTINPLKCPKCDIPEGEGRGAYEKVALLLIAMILFEILAILGIIWALLALIFKYVF